MNTYQPPDGGPAFPVASVMNANGDVQWGFNGMTLRDYFAAQVAPTYAQMKTGPYYDAKIKLWSASAVARQAYLVADAMLLERSRDQ